MSADVLRVGLMWQIMPARLTCRFHRSVAPAILACEGDDGLAFGQRGRCLASLVKPSPGNLQMDLDLALYSLTRILHVGTAIVVVGGTFFVRFVLFPAATQILADDVHVRLRSAVMGTWKKIVHSGIAL